MAEDDGGPGRSRERDELSGATVAGGRSGCYCLTPTNQLRIRTWTNGRQARINALTPAELDYIERRLAAKDGAA